MTSEGTQIAERWCGHCGVLLPPDAAVCPNCGTPAETPAVVVSEQLDSPSEALELEDHDDFDADNTHTMARIESAVPAGPDPYGGELSEEDLPRTRVSLLAAFAAVLVVGGTVLFITHPWDPTFFSTRATEPADTSMAGFPGEVDALTGQDSSAENVGMTGDEYSYQNLIEAHGSLVDLESHLGASEEALRTTGVSGSQEDREAGRDEQTKISVELSNLIARIDAVDVTSGTYAEDVQNLRTLGNWLRNWSDALTTAWSASASLPDASGHDDEILSSLYASAGSDGTNYYRTLFDQYIEEWTPAPPSE